MLGPDCPRGPPATGAPPFCPSRFKRLMRLAGPKAIARRVLAAAGYKTGTNGKFKLKTASRKKQTRGKTKKAAH